MSMYIKTYRRILLYISNETEEFVLLYKEREKIINDFYWVRTITTLKLKKEFNLIFFNGNHPHIRIL